MSSGGRSPPKLASGTEHFSEALVNPGYETVKHLLNFLNKNMCRLLFFLVSEERQCWVDFLNRLKGNLVTVSQTPNRNSLTGIGNECSSGDSLNTEMIKPLGRQVTKIEMCCACFEAAPGYLNEPHTQETKSVCAAVVTAARQKLAACQTFVPSGLAVRWDRLVEQHHQ